MNKKGVFFTAAALMLAVHFMSLSSLYADGIAVRADASTDLLQAYRAANFIDTTSLAVYRSFGGKDVNITQHGNNIHVTFYGHFDGSQSNHDTQAAAYLSQLQSLTDNYPFTYDTTDLAKLRFGSANDSIYLSEDFAISLNESQPEQIIINATTDGIEIFNTNSGSGTAANDLQLVVNMRDVLDALFTETVNIKRDTTNTQIDFEDEFFDQFSIDIDPTGDIYVSNQLFTVTVNSVTFVYNTTAIDSFWFNSTFAVQAPEYNISKLYLVR